MDLEIMGDSALVTASSSGLGKASATALAREGAHVVINGRDEERLAEARDEISEVATGEVATQQGDLTEKKDIEVMVETTVDEFGGLDHLVTSAGGPPSGPFLETTDEDWYRTFDLLVMSVVRLVREAEPALRANGGGSVVNITSRSVTEALDSLVLSNSVRMSVIGLEKTLSRELAPEIRVNAVLPGAHETSRIENLVEAAVERGEFDSYEAGMEARGESIPVGRVGDPMELGDTVAYLCSDRAGYINGESVVIDGGSTRSTL